MPLKCKFLPNLSSVVLVYLGNMKNDIGVDTEVKHLVMHKCFTQSKEYLVFRILPVSLMI